MVKSKDESGKTSSLSLILSLNDWFESGIYILSVLCVFYFLFKDHTVDRKVIQPVVVVSLLLFIRQFIKITKIDIWPSLRFSLMAYIFIAMYLGYEFNFYGLIPHFDKVEHTLSGILFSYIGFLMFMHINRKESQIQVSPITIVLFSLFFSITTSACWELYEFTLDHLFGSNFQGGSLTDTMTDIMTGVAGAVIGCTFLFYSIKNKK